MKTFLITGAAGFIGSNTVEALLKKGHQVIGLDNFSHGKRENLHFTSAYPDHFQFIEGDILDDAICSEACRNVDVVIHLAALGSVPKSIEAPVSYHQTNITGTVNMLEAARQAKVKRFVFASSAAVYGDNPAVPKTEDMLPKPLSPYALTKLTGEQYCALYYDCYGLETVSLRFFNVFGPKQDPNSQYAAAIPNFISRMLADQSPEIHGEGLQTRDFIYVQDVVAAMINCSEILSGFGESYNVGCGDKITILDLATAIKEELKVDLEFHHTDPRPGDIRESVASIQKAEQVGVIHRNNSYKKGLAETLDWYKSQLGAEV